MNIIVFDTETAGVVTQNLLNVGYMIVDLNLDTATYRTLVKRDYIMRDVWRNTPWMMNDMFVRAEKMAVIANNIQHKGAIERTEKQVFEQIARDIAKYGVQYGYAYNCQFDTDKFAKTAIAYGLSNPLEGITVLDLWGYAYWKICATEDYLNFCNAHNLRTRSEKFIPTSVEGVTKYLNNDPDFVEEHTALSDVYWELRILCECLKRGQNIFEWVTRGGWITPSGEQIDFDKES